MSSTTTGRRPSDPILGAVAVRRRRLALAILQDRRLPITERELATRLAAEEEEKSLVDVTGEEVRAVQVDLHHVHLPRLAAVSLVGFDPEEGIVTTTNHPALADHHLQAIVGTDEDGWDAVVASLASRRRRIVLAVLEDSGGPMTREELATAVARRETEADGQESSSEPIGDGVSDVLTSLHHTHLPKLDEAGLVSYDPDEGTVTFEGHPSLETEWLAFAADETPLPVTAAAHELSNV